MADAFKRTDECNWQNMQRVGLGIRTWGEIFEASEREYKEREEERRKKRRTKIGREVKDAEPLVRSQ